MKMFRLFCVVTVLALTLFTFTPAQAKAPVIIEYFFTDEPHVEISCGSFSIYDDWSKTHAVIKWFFDDEGNWVLLQGHVVAIDRFYNPANGKEVVSLTRFNKHWTPGYFSDRGLTYHVVVPGVGTILINTGINFSYDGETWMYRGNQQFYEGDLGKLCAYLQ